MATTEHTINDALAEALRKTRHAWRLGEVVRSENTGMLKGSNERPDILILELNVSPVVVETEFLPATTVEREATSRLGKSLKNGRKLLSSIAVRVPDRMKAKQGIALQKELDIANDLEIAVFTGSNPSDNTRWPRSGWIQGGVADLSILVQSASVPPEVIDKAADILVEGVSAAAWQLDDLNQSHPGSLHRISEALCQEDGTQTRRMAATILINAFLFQEVLAGGPGELINVQTLEELKNGNSGPDRSVILSEWYKILQINYWPIFDIARRILKIVPGVGCPALMEVLSETAIELSKSQLMRSHDLTGAVFQRLIADRKFLAAFYTTPAAASLLVGLAITPSMLSKDKSWGDPKDVKSLRIADFACGTGTLLSTAYQRIGQLHEIAGGNSEEIHPEMMASVLIGCDVLPAAAHLTASMLSGTHPTVKYSKSSILTVAYGKQSNDVIALGSLDLLDPQGNLEILSITAKALEGRGEAEKQTWLSLPHDSFDLVIMNPPFTRATGHEGKKIGIPNPMFAAFSSSAEEQRAMAKATERLTKGTSAHGNAGEASIFLVLADRKIRQDGVLALVMPLSLLSGEAWEDSRALLAKNYRDLILISISGAKDAELSFSADTDMGECLVIGRKSSSGSSRATFVILGERPAYPLVGASGAEQISQLISRKSIRRLEDGPLGGTLIHFGNDVIGQVLDSPLPASGGWSISRIADLSLAQTAHQLAAKKLLWLPIMNVNEVIPLPITLVEKICKIGPYHADVNGRTATGGIRGPFDIEDIVTGEVPTYPVLWSHDAKNERTISFNADASALVRQGKEDQEKMLIEMKTKSVWNSASHCHFNRDFRFNSQSTAMQFAPRRTIGGRAWLSIRLNSKEQEKTLALWGNTTLGMLLHWWHSNKQQAGRGSIGKQALKTLPVLDISAFSPTQLDEAVNIFDNMCHHELLPLHLIDRDKNRIELDTLFCRNVLKLPESILVEDGPLDLLRKKLSREPSIRGSK